MEVNSYKIKSTEKADKTLLDTQKQNLPAVENSTESQPTDSLPTIDASLLRAYTGIEGDCISKEDIFEYLRQSGVNNESLFDSLANSMLNNNGEITNTAFSFLKRLLPKTNIFRVQDYFLKAKDNNGINYKALNALDSILAPASPMGQKSYCETFLKDVKDSNLEFNDRVLNIVLKNAKEFQKAYTINQTIPQRFFRSLKDNDGLFDENAIDFVEKELEQNKEFYKLTGLINEAKDENGKFSPEESKFNCRLSSLFSGYTLQFIKRICNELPNDDKASRDNLVTFADSIQQDRHFNEIIEFVKNVKTDKNNNVGLNYNKESLEFLKKFGELLNFKNESLLRTLIGINKPFKEYSEDEIEKIKEFLLTTYEPDIVSAIIDTAKIKEGKNKGKVDFEDIDKAKFISNKTRITQFGENTNGEVIKELAKALSKEENSDALNFIYDLYSYKFIDYEPDNFFTDVFGRTTTFSTPVIRTITKFLCESDENGNPKHKTDALKIENLKKLIPANAPKDIRNSVQKRLFTEALELPENPDSQRKINTSIDDLCDNVLQNMSGEKIKKFCDFLEKSFNSSTGIFFVDKNDNIRTRVNIQMGNAMYPTNILYDFEKDCPISETYETWNKGCQTNITTDLINNTEIEQTFEYVNLNGLPYKELSSQIFKKYDENGKLISTEIVEKSPIDNVYDVTIIYPNGKTENISKATKTKLGTEIIEKNMTSFDGSKSYYRYEDDPDGNRILDYKIIDENGKTILNQSVTFEVIDKNNFVSSRNGKVFKIKFDDNKLFVTNEQTGQTEEILISGFTKNTQDKIIPILKRLPGEELFSMKELNLKYIYQDNSVTNAQYRGGSAKEISASDDFNDIAVILHEWGHGKDDLMFDKIKEKINNDKKLNEIYNYERDLFRKNLSDAQMSLISYFTADIHYTGDKAVKEGIAETNTILSVSPKNRTQSIRAHFWQQYFPKTIAYLSGLLN